MTWFEGFTRHTTEVNGQTVCYRSGGKLGAPVLVLLHGFPQTHVMWHRVAQALKHHFFVVMPDLRGYGDSSHHLGGPDHSHHSKRAMASDVVGLLDALGAKAFHLSGHDRGGRVAYRLALDHPDRVLRLSVLDIAPTLDMYNATDMAFAQAYYHWFHLTQAAPLPETMIAGNPLAYLHAKLGGWGSAGLGHIEPEALAEYERCFTHPALAANGLPAAIHTACEDYRAGASIDLEHDRASRAHGDKVVCPLHALWGAQGVVQRLFDPMALWQAQCSGPLSGRAMACGHFIPEALPTETAAELLAFHG